MDIIQNNPYRVIGILSNATTKELEKQKGKIKAYTKVGKELKSDLDFNFLRNIRREEDSVSQAFSNVEQNQDKVNFSQFWFLNASPFDNFAIEYLKNGDVEKAVEIWEKVTTDKEVNSRNFSAFNNLGTYKLLGRTQKSKREGIHAKLKLIESDFFENFVHSVADETFVIDKKKQIENLVDKLFIQLQSNYSSSQIMKLFIDCNENVQKYLLNKLTAEPINSIESQIEKCKKKRKIDKVNAHEFGMNLFKTTKDELSLLQSMLGATELKYKAVADQLANEIMQCGIDYYNSNSDNDVLDVCIKNAQYLNKTALSIAVGKMTKDRAKDHIETLEEMKDYEFIQTVNLLMSIKAAYSKNEEDIRSQVKKLKNDPDFILGYKVINQSAVEKSIKNSIDWKKVNDLIKESLTYEKIFKLKASTNIQLKSDFIEIANWLINYSQSNSVIKNIINSYRAIPPQLTFKVISSEITNSNNKPFYSKYIRYVGLKLNVEVFEDSTFKFDLKYVGPNGSVKRNSNISPNGYTQSFTKSINTQEKSIAFLGWGNKDECTYPLGKHRIEVYVDEYLIHTKEFIVELSPAEKIEKEITDSENKLKKLRVTEYYSSEIRTAKEEMKEIQKFKLFRSSATKEDQIRAQQNIIDKLIKRSKSDRTRDIKKLDEKIYNLRAQHSNAKF